MTDRKIHIRANKLTGENIARALCASKSIGNGLSVKNSRRTYADMSSEIVSMKEAAALPSDRVCAHCEALALAARNRSRANKGKAPIADWRDYSGE